MVIQIDKSLWFPDPHLADDDQYGMLAIGGDLSIDRLLLAYQNGIFPWFAYKMEAEPVWFCPQRRFVIFPDEIHISHSMRTLMNKGLYRISMNEDFEGVIRACSQSQHRDEDNAAWLGEQMIEAYTELNRQNFAASIEVWEPLDTPTPDGSTERLDTPTPDGTTERLVGGLYGVCIGPAFFGESMFSLVPSASKLALIHLAKLMQQYGGTLIDCQFETPHLKSMGGRFIDYDEYMRIISA